MDSQNSYSVAEAKNRLPALIHQAEKTGPVQAGRPMPETDGQIAATAEAHGLTLVTCNTADFKNYPNLKLENWFTT